MGRIRFTKGHGTQNDFVLVPDPDAATPLPPELVAALCDRRAGIGADGVIRVVRTAALVAAGEWSAAEAGTEWFMDYRNADGSLAEMCGNGVRVFAAYLVREGWVQLPDGGTIAIGSRAGVRTVRREGDHYAVDLGPWFVGDTAGEPGDGRGEVMVRLPGDPVPLPGLPVDVGNPHVVVAMPDAGTLARADLHLAPELDPVPRHGANVEVVVPTPPSPGGTGHLLMRVHERGSGETRSCGTGAAAAVIAARAWAGAAAPDEWTVDVPGGRLRVRTTRGEIMAGGSVELAGPAVLLADGEVDADALLAGLAAASPADVLSSPG